MKENQISGWVSLVFARKQMFNPRPITKRDKKGKSIWLISIGFPASSEYYGWYINVLSERHNDTYLQICKGKRW